MENKDGHGVFLLGGLQREVRSEIGTKIDIPIPFEEFALQKHIVPTPTCVSLFMSVNRYTLSRKERAGLRRNSRQKSV